MELWCLFVVSPNKLLTKEPSIVLFVCCCSFCVCLCFGGCLFVFVLFFVCLVFVFHLRRHDIRVTSLESQSSYPKKLPADTHKGKICRSFVWLSDFRLPMVKHFPFVVLSAIYCHYSDVIMSVVASQIAGVSVVYSTFCSGLDQRKYQSSASLAFVGGNSPVTAQRASNAEIFPFDDVIKNYIHIWPHNRNAWNTSLQRTNCNGNMQLFMSHKIPLLVYPC